MKISIIHNIGKKKLPPDLTNIKIMKISTIHNQIREKLPPNIYYYVF